MYTLHINFIFNMLTKNTSIIKYFYTNKVDVPTKNKFIRLARS